MKNFALILVIFTLSAQVCFASIPSEMLQGSTFKLDIPKFETESISGSFDGREIKFFEIEKVPEWDDPITRAEFLKLLLDNYDSKIIIVAAKQFPDVPEDSEYFEYIRRAQIRGWIDGYEDGNFGPYDTITRAQIAKILTLAFEPKQIITDIPQFSDVSEQDWHHGYIQLAAGARYFQGYPDGTMKPDRPINFQEAETVIKRAAVPQNFIPPESKTYYRGYIGVHRLADTVIKKLKIVANSTNVYPILVTKRDVPVESFYLEPSKNELFTSDKIDTTWVLINGAKANPQKEQLWEDKFIVPTDGILTLGFGDQLYINGSYAGSHFGLDYANVEGTPIYASNTGIVTLAEETMSYGNTIVIDHGHNIFTMYLHNNELTVQKGDHVEKGDLIAKMGSTGIATGPHLHFTVFVGEVIVDNYEWY